MQYFLSCFILLISHYAVMAQNIPIGSWKDHLPYSTAVAIAENDETIFCGTAHAMFTLDKEDNSIRRWSKVNGLSDIGMATLAYDKANALLLIAYNNTNLDILRGEEVTNIPDIKNKLITGEKRINNIYFRDSVAYLSSSLGIIILNLNKNEIKDTYVIGSNGAANEVYDLTILNDTIYAATQQGVKKASLQTSNLSDFNSWQLVPGLRATKAEDIEVYLNKMYVNINDSLFQYNNGQWSFFYTDFAFTIEAINSSPANIMISQHAIGIDTGKVVTIGEGFVLTQYSNISKPAGAVFSENNVLWVADMWKGLVKIEEVNYTAIIPNGPYSTDVFEFDIRNNEVWTVAGAIDNWNLTYNTAGFYLHDDYWVNFNLYNTPELTGEVWDLITVKADPNSDHVYIGSFSAGLLDYNNDSITIYDKTNSSLQGQLGDTARTHVSGLDLDAAGNLWLSNAGASRGISVKKTDGLWQSFRPDINNEGFYGQLLVDQYDQKWIVMGRSGGLMVFNHGETIENTTDDQYYFYSKGEGLGKLPSTFVLAIEEDKDGNIWIGTDKGIAVIYCPGSVFNGGCDAQQICIVQEDLPPGVCVNLLETETINSITVDGANRKWIGTNNGVFLISADGTEQILHFTVDNSPLFSNEIKDIGINGLTGEVFIGTSKGILSYKGEATEGMETQGSVLVYPNPVRPDYTGMIAVRGLVTDADIKITDISGTLIYQTRALGGQAVWNGKNYNGERARTGIYLVFSTDEFGAETIVAKILVLN